MSQVAFYERLVMSQNYDKSNLKLDFDNNKGVVNSRKRKFLGVPSAHLLQSPDLKLLTLGSPELERLIAQNDGFIPTPTPGGGCSSLLMQNGETPDDGKDSFARGFIEALQKLQEQDAPTTLQSLIDSKSDSLTSKQTVITQQPRWQQTDQNRNSVPVITPTRFENRTFDNRSPPLSRQPTNIPVVNNFPAVSTGAVSTMGMTAMPRASISYVTRPEQNRLTHQTNNNSLTSSGMTLPTPIMASSTSPILDVQVKSEDEAIVPHSESEMNNLDMNPIDLEVQEHIKHQRKKLRNRLAAQRCRKRKIEREDTLKIKVKELKSKNAELTSLASTLRMQVCDLKQQVMHHVNEGCQVFLKDSEEEKNLMSKSS